MMLRCRHLARATRALAGRRGRPDARGMGVHLFALGLAVWLPDGTNRTPRRNPRRPHHFIERVGARAFVFKTPFFGDGTIAIPMLAAHRRAPHRLEKVGGRHSGRGMNAWQRKPLRSTRTSRNQRACARNAAIVAGGTQGPARDDQDDPQPP